MVTNCGYEGDFDPIKFNGSYGGLRRGERNVIKDTRRKENDGLFVI